MIESFGGLEIFVAIVVVVVVAAIVYVFLSIKTVSQGMEYTVEYFGKYTRTLKPGFNVILPPFYRVGNKINMRETVMDVPSQEVISRDNAMIKVDGVVFFQVLNAAKAAYEVNDLPRAILNITMTNIRTVMGSMNLDDLLSKRDEINLQLLNVVDQATEPWGVKVARIEIKDISPPADLVEAMARQMKAERLKRAQILEAEGHRQAEILRAEGDKQAAILEAEGRKEAAFRDAEARERQAEAEAKATAMVSNYFVAGKYVDALGKFAESSNQKVFFLPVEASGVIGSIAGIAEIAKQAFGKDGE
jgi:regulator of protease activity HflC (stomatin/prohibitin superfamily)